MTTHSNGTRGKVKHLLGTARDEAPLRLADIDASYTHGVHRHRALGELASSQERLLELQTRLFAEGTRSLLIVLQGMDTSGKDGTVNHVISHFNPGGFTITNFKIPTAEEARHGFLWRIRRALPGLVTWPSSTGLTTRTS